MARALAPKIPSPSDRGSPAPPPNRRLRRWLARELRRLQPAIAAGATACQADRWIKHFTATTHAAILLYHALSRSPSLRQTHERLVDDPTPLGPGGAPAGGPVVGYSRLAEANTTRPAAFLAGLVGELLARVVRAGRRAAVPYPLDLALVDSTFIGLSVKLAGWLPEPRGTEPSGVRLQVAYRPALDLPDYVVLTPGRRKDTVGLDDLLLAHPERVAALAGWTIVLDLGYYSHVRFAAIRAAGGHVVTRRQAQATITVEAECPVQLSFPDLDGGRIHVHTDARVTVGSPTNRRSVVLPGMRLVTATVEPTPDAQRHGAAPVTYEILTDRWDLTAQEVIQWYLWRWQIELFFRWMKSEIGLARPLGYSENAIQLTVWLAIAAHLLTLLAAAALGLTRRSPALRARLAQVVLTLQQEAPDDSDAAVQLAFPWASAPGPAP